jgi:iron(III) transport system substrate-binding protein
MNKTSLLSMACSILLGAGTALAQPAPATGDAAELYENAKKEGGLTFYTSQVGVAEQQITQAFKKRYPGVAVEVVYAGGGALFERLRAEAAAGRDLADVHLQSDLPLMERLREAGLLAQWEAPEAKAFPATYRKDGYWTGIADVVNLLIYNKMKVKPAEVPDTWKALLDPKWSGRVGSVHVGGGGLPWAQYYFLRKDVDPDYWQKFAANKPVMFDGGGAVANAVASGKVDLGIVGSSVSYGAIQEGAPLGEAIPEDGLPGVIYSIAVLKAAKHPSAARLFVNWYLSKEGQETLVRVRGIDSPRKDVAPIAGRTPAGGTKIVVPTVEETEPVRSAWTKEWFELFRAAK